MDYRLLTVGEKDDLSKIGHALAKEMLLQKTEADTLFFQKTEHGKPYLPDSSWQFNISHSGNKVLCGVHNGAIGVDIEKPRPFNDRVAKRVCTPAEYAYIGGDSVRFLEVWTRKEAYAKLIGKGLSVSLKTIEVASETALHAEVCGHPVKTWDENGYVCSIIWETV